MQLDLNNFDKLAKSGTEHAHQRAFFAWLNAARLGGFRYACGHPCSPFFPDTKNPLQPELALFHAIPNGGMRDKITAAKLMAEGAKAGVADTFLPVPKPFTYTHHYSGDQPPTTEACQYHGLYIEFKEPGRAGHKDGGLSPEQVNFGDMVRDQGYCFRAAYSWREGANLVMSYYGVDWRIDTA